jgi:hypothetical protein
MNQHKQTYQKLTDQGYFSHSEEHRFKYFLTKRGQEAFDRADSTSKKANLFFTFLRTFRPNADQEQLNRLLAFAWADCLAGQPGFPYGEWPDCFDFHKNPLLSCLKDDKNDLTALLDAVSPKPIGCGLENPEKLFSRLACRKPDEEPSPLYCFQRELVYGWIQIRSSGKEII